MPNQLFGTPFSAYATHATSAVATQSGATGTTSYITDIAGSSDKAGSLLLVKDGSTIIWAIQLATSAAGINAFNQEFKTPLKITSGADCSVTVDGTSVCKANIAGYTI